MPQRIKTEGKIDPLTNTMIYRTHTRALDSVSKKWPSLTHSVKIRNSSQNPSHSCIEQLPLLRIFTLRQTCEVRYNDFLRYRFPSTQRSWLLYIMHLDRL